MSPFKDAALATTRKLAAHLQSCPTAATSSVLPKQMPRVTLLSPLDPVPNFSLA